MTAEQARAEALNEVADWHERQGRIFAETASKLLRDRASYNDIARAHWAAASHAAHATHIRGMILK